MTAKVSSPIREDLLRDSRYPVHKIADKLLPYLRVLVEQFHPEQVILFGSYANGNPDEHSDVDLLIVKKMHKSSVAERRDILKAWRPIRWSSPSLPFELLVVSPNDHQERSARNGGFYASIVRDGLSVALKPMKRTRTTGFSSHAKDYVLLREQAGELVLMIETGISSGQKVSE